MENTAKPKLKQLLLSFVLALFADWQGSLSSTGSIVLLGFAAYYGDKPVPRGILLGVALVFFLIASGRAWIREHAALLAAEDSLKKESALEKPPVVLGVEIIQLAKVPLDRTKADTASRIFVHARLELKEPQQAQITGYKLELSLHGNTESTEEQDRLDDWEARLWGLSPPVQHLLTPISPILKLGEPTEGWLHFIVHTPLLTIPKCSIRLIAQTAHGSGYTERRADTITWNPKQMILEKKKA